MIQKFLVLMFLGMLLSVQVMAQEVPKATVPAYNCDYQPSCEVAPGVYGKFSVPVTSKFNLSIGGFVKLDYAYNSVNFGKSGSVTPGSGAIPKAGSTAGNQEQSIFTARQSRIWFKASGPTFLGAKTGALIEVDFYGDPSLANEGPQVRMRHAYATLDWPKTQLLFGQMWDIFGPMAANTIDFRQGSPYGTPNNPRVPQIRLTQRVDLGQTNALRLVLGVQDPNQDDNNNSMTAAGFSNAVGSAVNVAGQVMLVSNALGTAPGFWGLSMNSLTAGFFGLFGSQKATNLANGLGDKSVDSWGAGFYTFVPILKSKDGKSRAMTMSLEAQAYLAANMLFSSATSRNFIGSTTTDPKAARAYGIGTQLIFFPIQDLGISAGYLRRAAYNYGDYSTSTDSGSVLSNFQKYNSNIFANVSYDLNAAVRIAAEYEYLNTHYGGNTATAAAVNASQSNIGTNSNSASGSANVLRLALLYFF
ncbi:MAG: hypothetical protein VB050_10885 [Geobacteraceae bacterium]|nr:hypothetical protein [Geobacteraceae bacterium]